MSSKRYRSEWKYCEKHEKLEVIRQRMAGLMKIDAYAGENGKYEVNSLYFDDYRNTCARENIAGECKRFKYRIRYYGNNSSKLWLEKKEKQNNYCYKQKCPITVEEYNMIINGRAMEVFWNTNNSLLRNFCTDIVTARFEPKVIISYERRAYIEEITNVRITFDYNISASDDIEKFLQGNYLKIPVLEENRHVLEVKFDDVLTSYMKKALQVEPLCQQAFSKYHVGRTTIQSNRKHI